MDKEKDGEMMYVAGVKERMTGLFSSVLAEVDLYWEEKLGDFKEDGFSGERHSLKTQQ